MAKNNKICATCGKQYHYCNNCAADNSKPAWMNMFCSENCKDLFQTATDYYAGELTASKAKAAINKLDTTNKDQFKSSIVRMIDELIEVEPEIEIPVVEIAEPEIQAEVSMPEEVISEEVKFETSEDVAVDEVSEDTTSDKKGKHNKKNRFGD